MFFWNERNEAHCLLEKFIRQHFFFLSLFFGKFFWARITFERYHFQSGYDPGNMVFFFTLWSLYRWVSTASRLEPLRGGSLLFTTKFPETSGTYFTNLGRMKGWVDLATTQWFWTRDPWIRNLVPWPLGHCSNSVEEVIYSRVKTISNCETTDYCKACKLSWIHFFCLRQRDF